MGDPQYDKTEELFQQAADLPREERASFLEKHAGDAPAVRAEVEELLEHLEQGQVASLAVVDRREPADLVGRRIGPYRILEPIGEGGFGSVFLAEQEEPIRRRVAVKVIKLGMDTRQVIARFESERQALAMMDHPNIARVLDAGSTDTGRPYFVMEQVRGCPITEYCDRHRLTVSERLSLFVQVCHAVQHAHQKGIIHRDLKPSNVLVARHDGAAVPKVIDFGIAKATDRRLTSWTVATERHQFIGTPEYMSPEQAGEIGTDIDTRSDIYSLGVLLYVLLTGETPFDRTSLQHASYDEIQRVIREEIPILPSRRVSGIGEKLESVARSRRAAPQWLSREFRGDLDWIVMNALEKDRNRRYETAASLAADIQRHLDHEPVLAGRPSRWYRLRKFVRRHRVGVGTGLTVAVALIIGFAVAMVGLIEANRARVALLRERDDARAARIRESIARAAAEANARRVRQEADKLRAAQAFLGEILAAANPGQALDANVSMRTALDRATRRLDDGFLAEQPGVEAAVRMTLGKTYGALGFHDIATRHLQISERLHGEVFGETAPETFVVTNLMIAVLNRDRHYPESEKKARRTLALERKSLGAEHVETLSTMDLLAVSLWRQGRLPEAEALHRKVLAVKLRTLGEDQADTFRSMANLGATLHRRGKLDQAERFLRRAITGERRLFGPDHPQILVSQTSLAVVLADQRRNVAAEALHRDILARQRRVFGPYHPGTRRTLINLLQLLNRQGKVDECRPLVQDLIAARRWAAEQPNADARTLHDYAWLLVHCVPTDLRDPETALPVAERAADMTAEKDPKVLETLALAYRRTGHRREAADALRRALKIDAGKGVPRFTFRERLLIGWSWGDRGFPGAVDATVCVLAFRRS